MYLKNKNHQKLTKRIASLSAQAGILLMSAATTFGLVELPNHNRIQVIVPNRPLMAFANEKTSNNNPLRREREETETHYISYSISQRTPARSGKR